MRDFYEETEMQRRYYQETAKHYDSMHVSDGDEHYRALNLLCSFLSELECRSILDIGSGTGRTILHVKKAFPEIHIIGIEPAPALRDIGYSKGVAADELVDGDAQNLSFETDAFDMVCEFGALHHIPKPGLAVSEMLRVARKAIFISDSNNFGQGGTMARIIKQLLNGAGLWGYANFLNTRGRGYHFSEGDGLSYSYSVFNDYGLISKNCREILLLNTSGKAINMYRSSPHVALLGIK